MRIQLNDPNKKRKKFYKAIRFLGYVLIICSLAGSGIIAFKFIRDTIPQLRVCCCETCPETIPCGDLREVGEHKN